MSDPRPAPQRGGADEWFPRAAFFGFRYRPHCLAAGAAVGAYSAVLLLGAHRGWLALLAAASGLAGGVAFSSDAWPALPYLGYALGLVSVGLGVGADLLGAVAYGLWAAVGGARLPALPAVAGLAAADVLSLAGALILTHAAAPPALAASAALLVLVHGGAALAARESHARSQLALTDPLTGLANQRLLNWRLAEELSQAQRTGGTFALVRLDLRNFHDVNLRVGRRAGDRALIQIAQILRDSVRIHDVVARVEGDDFAIVAPGLDEPGVTVVVERIRAAVARATTLPHPLSLDAGWAIAPRDAADAAALLETAEGRAFEQKLRAGSASPALPVDLMTAMWSLPEGAQQLLRLLHTDGIELEEHLSRVGRWSLELGQMVGLDSGRQEVLAQAALLHDVGKLVIPRSLLTKPGALTPEEQDIRVRHVTAGVALLRAVGVDEAVVAIVAAHHERWDGTGYPAGTAGDRIPIEARILAIADGCDAMTEQRPYRKPWSVDEAIADVQLEGGRQYDPDLVNLIIPVLSSPE